MMPEEKVLNKPLLNGNDKNENSSDCAKKKKELTSKGISENCIKEVETELNSFVGNYLPCNYNPYVGYSNSLIGTKKKIQSYTAQNVNPYLYKSLDNINIEDVNIKNKYMKTFGQNHFSFFKQPLESLTTSQENYKSRITSFNKYLKYSVYKISDGENVQYCLQTHELLKMVHEFNEERLASEQYKSGLAQYRDIRQLVSNSTNTRYEISPKRNCVLLNLPYRKCILLKDILYYIPTFTNNATIEVATKEEQICRSFIEQAKKISSLKGNLPFEILILEIILVDVSEQLKKELEPIIAEAEKLFEVISTNLSVYKCLKKLTEMRRKLKIIDEKVHSVHKTIQQILNNDEDLKRLEVSYFWNCPEIWDECGSTPNSEDTEMLLEYYCHEIEEFIKIIHRTDESLDDVLQMVELNLDDARNNVLKVELGLKIYSVVISVIGTIAAIFGMNIKNGFEGNSSVFWWFALLMMSISFYSLCCMFISFKKVNF